MKDHSHIYGSNAITRDLPEAKLWNRLEVARSERRSALENAMRELWKHKLPNEVHNALAHVIHAVQRIDDGSVELQFAEYLEAAAEQRLKGAST